MNLQEFTNSRLGRFGEHIFIDTIKRIKNDEVIDIHEGLIDYIVDKKPVDVKTTRLFINKDFNGIKKYNGHKIKNIDYPYIVFFRDGVQVTFKNKMIDFLTWKQAEKLWLSYKEKNRLSFRRKEIKNLKVKNSKKIHLKRKLCTFFKEKNIRARVICRCNPEIWGKDSPGNLKPSQKQLFIFDVTIYLVLDNQCNEKKVYAIPHKDMEKIFMLFMLKKPRLHKEKIDLDLLPKKYVFLDIADLKDKYSRLF
jgi:hypothetical protein